MFLKISDKHLIESDSIVEVIKEDLGLRIIMTDGRFYFLSSPDRDVEINLILNYINGYTYIG